MTAYQRNQLSFLEQEAQLANEEAANTESEAYRLYFNHLSVAILGEVIPFLKDGTAIPNPGATLAALKWRRITIQLTAMNNPTEAVRQLKYYDDIINQLKK